MALLPGSVANILETYTAATKAELRHGLRWYASASTEATRRLVIDRRKALGIVAALSPQCPWSRNIDNAELFIAGKRIQATGDMLRKAARIWEGSEPLDVLGGNKVRAFFACLIDQNVDDVCVDRHALCCWRAEYATDRQRLAISDKLYRTAADDYRTAAEMVGIKPHQLQATTWLAWRRLNVKPHFLRGPAF